MLANEGKFRDRNPDISAAGKLTAGGDHTTDCIVMNTPNIPHETIQSMWAKSYPAPGEKRTYVGKYANPEVLAEMRHGIETRSSENACKLVNPAPQTFFLQQLNNRKEQVYDSKNKKPLGESPDQSGKFAEGVSILDTFGIKTEKSVPAGLVVNPKISRAEVQNKADEGIELYKKSHQYSHVGEQKDLNYNWSRVKKSDVFGVETPHSNDGSHVKNCLLWTDDPRNAKTQTLVSKRLDDFKERTQPKLGEVHDPIKDSMKIATDHTFGVMITPDEYGAGDLIHHREANCYLRARDRERGSVAAIRDHLKKSNYHNFDDLNSAFSSYDVNKSGKIEAEDLMRVCKSFHLPVDDYLLNNLISYCDSTGNGSIDYIDFCKFLNWKYDVPTENLEKLTVKDDKTGQKDEETSRIRQIDGNLGEHQTSSSVINAIAGQTPTHDFRSFGVPTIRSDLPAPRIKRVGDHTNYGEQSDVYGLVNPSIYTSYGLMEKDFFLVRSKDDIKSVFAAMKLGLSDEEFDLVYGKAAELNEEGGVSVDSFLHTLKTHQAAQAAS